MSLRSKNLNLLPILQALLDEQSVARAGEQVGLSQPAVSGALAQLRKMLDDPLLVRTGRSMHLTPRARRMKEELNDVCARIELLFQPETFDPATAHHDFVVAAPDYLALQLSEFLLVRLGAQAPNIRVSFVDIPMDAVDALQSSSIDLAVCADFDFWPGLRREYLFRDRIVAAVAQDHPLAGKAGVTSKDLAKFPTLNYSHAGDPQFVTGIPSLDICAQISLSQFTHALFLAAKPPTVARVPASLVERLSEFLPLAVIELEDEETGFDTGMFWTGIKDEAHEHKWLRTVVGDSVGSTFPDQT